MGSQRPSSTLDVRWRNKRYKVAAGENLIEVGSNGLWST